MRLYSPFAKIEAVLIQKDKNSSEILQGSLKFYFPMTLQSMAQSVRLCLFLPVEYMPS